MCVSRLIFAQHLHLHRQYHRAPGFPLSVSFPRKAKLTHVSQVRQLVTSKEVQFKIRRPLDLVSLMLPGRSSSPVTMEQLESFACNCLQRLGHAVFVAFSAGSYRHQAINTSIPQTQRPDSNHALHTLTSVERRHTCGMVPGSKAAREPLSNPKRTALNLKPYMAKPLNLNHTFLAYIA